ncbi:MAG TPA: hypothetical protein VF331_10750 [Polyangiales bacterium]
MSGCAWFGSSSRVTLLSSGAPSTTLTPGPKNGVHFTELEGSSPEAHLQAAIDHANTELYGTLGANIVIHPKTIAQIGRARFEEMLIGLHCGTIAINAWTGLGFLTAQSTWVVGPTLGVSLHYGPDYRSDLDGHKFFAIGPIVGGYVGLDFPRPGKIFNFELGLTPYLIPLFGVNDPANHAGIVVGGLFDASFRFAPSKS